MWVEWLRAWVGFAALVVSICAIVIARWDRAGDQQKDAMKSMQQGSDLRHTSNLKRFDSIGERLSTLAERVEHLPDQEDLGKIYDELRTVRSSVDKMEGSHKMVTDTLARISNFLMERGK